MNVIISQAMATGLPVVSTDHSGFPDQVVEGRNGFTAPEGDYRALAEKLLFLIEHAELWPSLGRAGRAHVEKHYDAKTLIVRQLECYRRVIESGTEGPKRLWDVQWTNKGRGAADILEDRFTREAFRCLGPFMPRADAAVLEAGCGTGRFSALFAQRHPRAAVVGIDSSPTAVATARRVAGELECANATFLEASIFALPFPDGHFDLVFNEGVLPLFDPAAGPSYEDALREMIRVTKPGGKVVVSVANWLSPHTLYKSLLPLFGRSYEYGYEKSFTRAELTRLLGSGGLRDLEHTGFYPSYGFYRQASSGPAALRLVLRSLGRLTDLLDGERLSMVFGFQIVAAGTK